MTQKEKTTILTNFKAALTIRRKMEDAIRIYERAKQNQDKAIDKSIEAKSFLAKSMGLETTLFVQMENKVFKIYKEGAGMAEYSQIDIISYEKKDDEKLR